MTVEPPPGMKANLLRSLGGAGGVVTKSVSEDLGPGPTWKRLLFGLCFFMQLCMKEKSSEPWDGISHVSSQLRIWRYFLVISCNSMDSDIAKIITQVHVPYCFDFNVTSYYGFKNTYVQD